MKETLAVLIAVVITRSVGIRRRRTEAVGSSGIICLGKRRRDGVTDWYICAREETRGDTDIFGKIELVMQFSMHLDELGERTAT